jgi:hypothetical protein
MRHVYPMGSLNHLFVTSNSIVQVAYRLTSICRLRANNYDVELAALWLKYWKSIGTVDACVAEHMKGVMLLPASGHCMNTCLLEVHDHGVINNGKQETHTELSRNWALLNKFRSLTKWYTVTHSLHGAGYSLKSW